jgi:hypothetical protein
VLLFPRTTTLGHCSSVSSSQQCRSFYPHCNVTESIFSTFRIYGVTWQQGYAYYTIHGNRDRLFVKVLVSKPSYNVPPSLLIATRMKVSILMYVPSFIIEVTHSLLRRPICRVLDSVNLAFAAHGSYIMSITNFGDYAADTHRPWLVWSRTFIMFSII